MVLRRRLCEVLIDRGEQIVSIGPRSRVVSVAIGAQTGAETHGVTAGGCRRVVLQFKNVLVVARYARVAASGGEGALNGYGGSEVGGDLAVAHAAPLEMCFVDHPRVHHHCVAYLD